MKTIIQTELELNELIELIKLEIRTSIEKLLNEKNDKDIFLTRKEVLDILKISSPTLKKITNEGLISPVRFGNGLRYSKKQLYRYLEERNE